MPGSDQVLLTFASQRASILTPSMQILQSPLQTPKLRSKQPAPTVLLYTNHLLGDRRATLHRIHGAWETSWTGVANIRTAEVKRLVRTEDYLAVLALA